MSSTATLTNHRQSPRKVRLLADLVRGKAVDRALMELELAPKRAALPIAKLIRSAVANAKIAGSRMEDLIVKDIRVDKGIVMKRMMPRARGSAYQILKRTSHIVVTLGEKNGTTKGTKETAKSEKRGEEKPKAKAKTKTKAKIAK